VSDANRDISRIEVELSRDLGLPTALAIGVGTMIAAGIFTLSGLAVRNVGSAAIAAFLLAAVVATFTALTYCEFTSIYPRSGEGYLYARKTFAGPLAWVVGWCLFLGYTSSCAFYLVSLATYFHEFIWAAPWPAAIALVSTAALTLLNIKGTKESGSFQIVVTVGKVLLLLWFVAGGISAVSTEAFIERFSTDMTAIGSTAGMVFITFFGFSAIAAAAGEVRSPVRTIPRAIFISMGVVTVLYALVIVTIVAAGLDEYTEAAMGTAATRFLGPVGGIIIVAGALFSMISASNASIMAGSRVTMAMSQQGHLPRRLGRIHPRLRTPAVALLAVGAAIGVFSLLLPLEDLAHFADTVLLLALIMVNAALISHRRRFPDIERPFRVPMVPLLPGLGIVANIYLLTLLSHHWLPVALAVGTLLLGVLGFLLWKGLRGEERALPGGPTRVALEAPAKQPGRYRVLVPIARPETMPSLFDFAACVAAERDGEVVAMRVVQVPEQVPPRVEDAIVARETAILQAARERGHERGVPVTTLVRIGHNVARAILETSRERHCNLIVLGWKGYASSTERVLGRISDTVVTRARANIAVMRRVGDKPVRRLLLPTAGGEHARRAEEYAASLARTLDGSITVCTVVPTDAPEEVAGEAEIRLAEASARLGELPSVQTTVLSNNSVVDAIVAEAEHHDAVIIGAAGLSSYRQLFLGNIVEDVARQAPGTVVVVKRHSPVKAAVARVLAES